METPIRQGLPRQKLITTAADLVFKQGWNATGINQILNESDVPKGSFYYYFQSKDDLGVALVKHHADLAEGLYQQTLLNTQLTARQGIEEFFRVVGERAREDQWRFGCPIGSMANEVADSIDKIAVACREALTRFVDVLEKTIERGVEDGSINVAFPPEKAAKMVSQLWQGSLLLMKTERAGEPLTVASDTVRQMFFAAG